MNDTEYIQALSELNEAIDKADAIIVGAGAGLSTAISQNARSWCLFLR